ncbi:MAG: leucine-rich repeat domain-containing protein, partial [Kiritimatiellae bacterium]|nr:leucine-rich repeat domain-containing protein [Kiritimatiellia bacterium]
MKTPILATFTTAAIAASIALGDSYTNENGLVWSYRTNGAGTATLTSVTQADGAEPSGALAIPSSVNGVPVTAIAAAFCRYNHSITNLTVADTVTEIGAMAFAGCTELTGVILGNGLVSIGGGEHPSSSSDPDEYANYGAFGKCLKLETVAFGSKIASIGAHAFSECQALKTLTLPDSVQTLGVNAFYHNKSLATVTLGTGLTAMGECAFANCTALKNVLVRQYGDAQKALFDGVFDNCSIWTYSLSGGKATITAVAPADGAVSVPSSAGGNPVTAIANNVGKGCENITSLVITDTVKTIGYGAFALCTSLGEVVLGDGVTTLNSYNEYAYSDPTTAWYAFGGCTALTNVVFGSSLTAMYGSFCRCTALERVVLPDSLVTLGADSFFGCTKMTSASLGPNLTTVGGYSFYGCTRLREV